MDNLEEILRESFRRSYGREPTAEELKTFKEYLSLIGKLPSEKFQEIHEFVGKEVLADLYGVNSRKLDDANFLKRVCEEAAKEANMVVVDTFIHQYKPQGVDVFVALAESSICIHSYPEHSSCFVNVFVCGKKSNALKGIMYIIEKLEPREVRNMQIIPRGIS
jgi:S-adenosylmethionine decarboxylase proenzyme